MGINDIEMLLLSTDKKRRAAHNKNLRSRRESDHLANGDHFDDQEVESELGDAEDEVVTDNGFGLAGGNWANNAHKANQYKGALRFVQKHHRHHNKRHSDEVANGDPTDDKEVEDVKDVNDDIGDDHGFRATVNWPKAGLAQKHHHHHHVNQPRPPAQSFVSLGKESDWIANADAADDKEVESEMGDEEDEIVSDTGFALSSGIW